MHSTMNGSLYFTLSISPHCFRLLTIRSKFPWWFPFFVILILLFVKRTLFCVTTCISPSKICLLLCGSMNTIMTLTSKKNTQRLAAKYKSFSVDRLENTFLLFFKDLHTKPEPASLPNPTLTVFRHIFHWAMWGRFPQRNLGLAIRNPKIALNHILLHSRAASSVKLHLLLWLSPCCLTKLPHLKDSQISLA